jgi:GrpB-like predicted nucleotidyltransferase (UPF0157 family)
LTGTDQGQGSKRVFGPEYGIAALAAVFALLGRGLEQGAELVEEADHPPATATWRLVISATLPVMSDGVDDQIEAWKRLRETKGRQATVLDLYRLVAEPRGLDPHQLPREERLTLSRSVMPLVWPGFEITAGSTRADIIELVDYDSNWPRRFEQFRSGIIRALSGAARRIEHIGSTSIPGLAAKPIIDIQVSVADMNVEATYVPCLEALGLQLRSRDALHRYFRPFPDAPREVHVHVCNVGSEWEREHLLFRDYLRGHTEEATRYAQAKWEAVRIWADDGWGYTDAKTETVLIILERAEIWAREEGWAP